MNSNSGKPLYSIQTVYSVSHINWRPGFKHHIASSGLMDSKIHLWYKNFLKIFLKFHQKTVKIKKNQKNNQKKI